MLVVASLASLSYTWGATHAALEDYYAAAARSMSDSWRDFAFGGFDPWGTVTVDKLPGSLWPQAASVRLFGVHPWAFVLPQVLEGVLTVLVLYRVVNRLAGPRAAITAAVVLAATPITVGLGRGNVDDSLMILCLVLAADAAVRTVSQGRTRSLLAAGAWVGVAFQAKMAEAWLVLPALMAFYLLTTTESVRRRLLEVGASGLVAGAVSLSWITAVSLVPQSHRPYVDASVNDSEFSQVFLYNGWDRIDTAALSRDAGRTAPFILAAARVGHTVNGGTRTIPASWHRMLSGAFGRDFAWFLPVGLAGALGVLLRRRRQGWPDPLRSGVVLWLAWLVPLAVVFSLSADNSYYTAALVPPVAALCGMGTALITEVDASPRRRRWVGALVAASVGYDVFLLHSGQRVPAWLVPTVIGAAVVGLVGLLAAPVPAGRRGPLWVAVAALLLAPAVASAQVVVSGMGPFDSPYESTAVEQVASYRLSWPGVAAGVFALSVAQGHPKILMATDTSFLASAYILVTGEEVLPIGGYRGGIPAPTLNQLEGYIRAGQLRSVILPLGSLGGDRRLMALTHLCRPAFAVGPAESRTGFGLYRCGTRLP